MNNKLQWTSLVAALALAIGSQATSLEKVVPAVVVIWILAVCNVASAVLPSLAHTGTGTGTGQAFQWATVAGAVSTAVAAQVPALAAALPAQAPIWILMATNIVSAVLPSVTGTTTAPTGAAK